MTRMGCESDSNLATGNPAVRVNERLTGLTGEVLVSVQVA